MKLSGIGKMYGTRMILRNISLHTHPGELSFLVGANGAGKTTLLRIMAGLAKPTAGSLDPEYEAGELAYLGHRPFLYSGMTALENLAFWNKLQGHPETSLLTFLQRVELDRFAHERAGSFSRGMVQRLNLARVLLQAPRVLLLDEPETGLDKRSLALLRREMRSARDNGATIVWITHDLQSNAELADRVLTIAGKTLAYDGSVSDWPGLEALEERIKNSRTEKSGGLRHRTTTGTAKINKNAGEATC